MSDLIENRLREAYQAKTAQLTEQRLDQLTEARERGLDGLLGGEHTAELPVLDLEATPTHKRHRWIAPTLAAAAVAALAIGVTAVTGIAHDSRPTPNPPASQISSPPPSSSAPAPSASSTPTQTAVAPPYLPAGQTGSRDQVPWSAVGSGWRLLQSESAGDYVTYDRSLYLYDPAGGRYLITDRLPDQSILLAWSPDGRRAMLWTGTAFSQLDLHTGSIVSRAVLPDNEFSSYTTPHGLAMIVGPRSAARQSGLKRYSTDGKVEMIYPDSPAGVGEVPGANVLYTPDGTQFVTATRTSPVVFSNDGHLIRQFPAPTGFGSCEVLKWWSASTVLESCWGSQGNRRSLFLQPLGGGAPSVLIDSAGPGHLGYQNAWQLSSGEVLLEVTGGCGYGGNVILNPISGSIRPLKFPAGVTAPGAIINMDGDVATFLQRQHYAGCGGQDQSNFSLIDSNLVTGQTRKLIDGKAILVNWPGDGN